MHYDKIICQYLRSFGENIFSHIVIHTESQPHTLHFLREEYNFRNCNASVTIEVST